jgi:hypothetical protein
MYSWGFGICGLLRRQGIGQEKGRVLVVDDDALTGWIASPSERLANEGRHAVIVFKRHVEDVYDWLNCASSRGMTRVDSA